MSAETAPPQPLLTASGLALERGGRMLFSGLDLELRPGGALLVRGPNGAGKSSLLLALAGILRPDAGSIVLTAPPSPALPARGRVPSSGDRTIEPKAQSTSPLAGDVAQLGPKARSEAGRGDATNAVALADDDTSRLHLLAHTAGLKPQLTVAENLTFWRTLNGPTGASIRDALDSVGLGGLEAVSAGHLSAGQAKRLALARLLVSRRAVWLLDEPTASLDADGQAILGRLLAVHLHAGGGAIIATHDEIAGLANAPALTLGPK